MHQLTNSSLLILILFFLCASLSAQEQDFRYYDQLTYDLYQQKHWKELVKVGKEAMHEGYDYYYMQIRIAIAYYELKRYFLAEQFFINALNENNNDPAALEYLYFCYLLTNRELEAATLVEQKDELFNLSSVKPYQLVLGLHTDNGYKFSSKSGIGDVHYFSLGITHKILPKTAFFHSYNRLNCKIINYYQQGRRVMEAKNNLIQHGYYVNAKINFAHGWILTPAYHVQNLPSINLSNHLLSIGLTKRWRKWHYSFTYNYSSINDFIQNQYTGGIILNPFGNLDLSLGIDFTYHQQEYLNENIFAYLISGRILKSIWISGKYQLGNMYHFSEDDGYYIFNGLDVINSRVGLSLIAYWNLRNSLFITFLQENKFSSFYQYDYKHLVLSGGIHVGL